MSLLTLALLGCAPRQPPKPTIALPDLVPVELDPLTIALPAELEIQLGGEPGRLLSAENAGEERLVSGSYRRSSTGPRRCTSAAGGSIPGCSAATSTRRSVRSSRTRSVYTRSATRPWPYRLGRQPVAP